MRKNVFNSSNLCDSNKSLKTFMVQLYKFLKGYYFIPSKFIDKKNIEK